MMWTRVAAGADVKLENDAGDEDALANKGLIKAIKRAQRSWTERSDTRAEQSCACKASTSSLVSVRSMAR